MSSKKAQTFSIDDAFEDELTDAIRVYGATAATERSPLNNYNRNGYINTPNQAAPAATNSIIPDDVQAQIHDPSNPQNIKPIIRGINKPKMDIDTVSKGSDSLIAGSPDEDDDGCDYEFWCAYPEKVISLYEKITQHKVIEFNWKCPGRRNPEDETTQSLIAQESVPESKTSEPEVTDFDFEDEATPQLSRLGKSATPKGGGKKKTTSLAGILSNMERHRIMDQGDKQ